MRLIHTSSFMLKEFNKKIPPYTILSHTWRGNNGDHEVTFAEYEKFAAELLACVNPKSFANLKNKYPYLDKILGACKIAKAFKMEYLWVDTCCIDKSKSAELNESINSMFSWYERATMCFVYLDDYMPNDKQHLDIAAFRHCRWFKRVWTLQELLAPQVAYFYDKSWGFIGDKSYLGPLLSDITRIETDFLEKRVSIQAASVAKRMSWAAGRKATREEDKAYSLLGIFGVNMPLIYGERSKSFIRLQEEILKEIDDHSIFAWKEDVKKRREAVVTKCGVSNCESPACDVSVCANPRCQNGTCTIRGGLGPDESNRNRWSAGRQIRGLFATSPDDFANSGNVTSFSGTKTKEGHITITNRGIYMPSMRSSVSEHEKDIPVLVLNCVDHGSDPIAIYLHHEAGDQYTRAWPDRTTYCSSNDRHGMYVLKTLSTFRSAAGNLLENSIILNWISGSITILQMPAGPLNRKQKKVFPTLSRVPYHNSLLVMVPIYGLARIWFGIKLKQEKDHDILPWCRGEFVSTSPLAMGLSLGLSSPIGLPSLMGTQYGPQKLPTLPRMAPLDSPQHVLPWPLEECSDEHVLSFRRDQTLIITNKQRVMDGYDVFNLEIRFLVGRLGRSAGK
ncbi:heterokaryon incompatibility protein-domain-containing protein [Xylaria cubensis]|nr:heterokaryon incompatibility protein-domain-containing protein [Xylaria cubensis]